MTEPTHTTPPEGNSDTTANGKRPLDTTASSKKSDRSKRFRVSRACDQCRAGRERCDGAQPSCQTCETQCRPCTYNEPPKKRGIQPNYIRTLELTLAWLFKNIPESERRLSQLLPRPEESAHRLIAFKDVADSEALHQVWRNGIICRQIDQLLSGAEIEGPEPAYQSHAVYQSPPLSAPSESSMRRADVNEPGSSVELPQAKLTPGLGSDRELLKLPENAWSLLEDYFAFTHTWLPITEKHDILRLMYTYPEAGLSRASAGGLKHAELWSIMAYASASAQSRAGDQSPMCHDIARSLIPRHSRIQLGHVKALLILSLTEIANESWIAAWLTVGSAIRLLTHLFPGQAPGESSLAESRAKHTYLAAYLLESTVASQTKAMVHLKTNEIREIGPLVEDGMEEWSPWHDPTANSGQLLAKSPARSISTFNDLVRIALRSQNSEQSPVETGSRKELDVVLELLRNASASDGRVHPSSVISRFRLSASAPTSSPSTNTVQTDQPQASLHIRTSSHTSHINPWANQHSGVPNALLEHQYPFMSIPNEGVESLPGSTPAQAQATPNLWARDGGGASLGVQDMPSFPPVDGSSSATAGGANADIFEELAMLDRTESSQNPKFMQNLGFGPDLDLAEFFGADYQPSDPLLAYMQQDTFADLSHAYAGASKDAG